MAFCDVAIVSREEKFYEVKITGRKPDKSMGVQVADSQEDGVMITQLAPGSPAAAVLTVNHVVVTVNGKHYGKHKKDFVDLVSSIRGDVTLKLHAPEKAPVVRMPSVDATLTSAPALGPGSEYTMEFGRASAEGSLGIQVRDVDGKVAVTGIDDDHPEDICEDDVVVAINGKPFRGNRQEMGAQLAQLPRPLSITFRRPVATAPEKEIIAPASGWFCMFCNKDRTTAQHALPSGPH